VQAEEPCIFLREPRHEDEEVGAVGCVEAALTGGQQVADRYVVAVEVLCDAMLGFGPDTHVIQFAQVLQDVSFTSYAIGCVHIDAVCTIWLDRCELDGPGREKFEELVLGERVHGCWL
jgi:hypothetical protein